MRIVDTMMSKTKRPEGRSPRKASATKRSRIATRSSELRIRGVPELITCGLALVRFFSGDSRD
jgi:hypothetical protein